MALRRPVRRRDRLRYVWIHIRQIHLPTVLPSRTQRIPYARREIPRTTPNETLDLLNQYIEEQASLTIGYADTNGGVSNRVIDPLSISLGTLSARDHATGQIVPFKISRITGVNLAK